MAKTLWEYVALNEYHCPPESVSEAIGTGLRGLWNRLIRRTKRRKSDEEQEEFGHSVPQELLDRLSPAPDWHKASLQLQASLENERVHDSEKPALRAVVGAPGSGVAQVVTLWAEREKLSIVSPPSAEQILKPDLSWLSQIELNSTKCLVIPELHRYFLRHRRGLQLFRQLLVKLWHAQLPIVIGCDSWAWAYLAHVTPIRSIFTRNLTLAPFDSDRLQEWFSSTPTARKKHFRRVREGRTIASSNAKTSSNADADSDHLDAASLQSLANWSRGIPEVAQAGWRQTLRLPNSDSDQPETVEDEQTLWLDDPSKLKLSNAESDLRQIDNMILHTILLHGGLPEQVTAEVMPFAPSAVLQSMMRLASLKYLELRDAIWRVPHLRYPSVRKHLRSEGYLVDESH